MRKIEQEMLQAVKNGKNFSKSNTAVNIKDDVAKIYLHGNLIATHNYITHTLEPYVPSLLRYPTATTCSRLRALGVDVSISKGAIYLNGEEVK